MLPPMRCCIDSVVNSGTETLFWKDRWCMGRAPMYIWPELFSLSARQNATFNELGHLLEEQPFCEEYIIQTREKWRSNGTEEKDIKRWSLIGNGVFSVKSLYNFMNDRGLRCEL